MDSAFFLILGMHRSGTSFLARALNVSGVYLGKLSTLISHSGVKTVENPKGHWESRNFLELSKKIFEENDLYLDTIPKKIICSEKIKGEFENEVKNIVSGQAFSSGVKDPRLVLFVEQIYDVFPENTIPIGIFRHPLKVAQSLQVRDGFDYSKSLQLWKVYNEKLLEVLEKHEGFLINFDLEQGKLLDEINKIVKKTGLIDTDLKKIFAEEFRRSDKNYDETFEIPEDVKIIYDKLVKRTELNAEIEIIPISFSIEESKQILAKMNDQMQEQLGEIERIQINLNDFMRSKLGQSQSFIRFFSKLRGKRR
jgi:hypothetical protein